MVCGARDRRRAVGGVPYRASPTNYSRLHAHSIDFIRPKMPIFSISSVASVAAAAATQVRPPPPSIVGMTVANGGATATNSGNFVTTGYNVTQLTNTNSQLAAGTATPSNPTTAVAATGSFSLIVSRTSTVYLLLVGAGGGGGCGTRALAGLYACGGGGGGGQCLPRSVTLSPGTYSVNFTIGGAGRGAPTNVTNAGTTIAAGGYGCLGGDTTLTLNGVTYTAVGGAAGARFNGTYETGTNTGISIKSGAYGGGCGGTFGSAKLYGSGGTVLLPDGITSQYSGGSNPNPTNLSIFPGAGGGGAGGNGGGGTGTNATGPTGTGGVGGDGVSTNTFSGDYPGVSFTTEIFLCGGGGGASGSNTSSAASNSAGGAGGSGGGGHGANWTYSTVAAATQYTWASGYGSGGGGGQESTVHGGYEGGSGSNGAIFISFEAA